MYTYTSHFFALKLGRVAFLCRFAGQGLACSTTAGANLPWGVANETPNDRNRELAVDGSAEIDNGR